MRQVAAARPSWRSQELRGSTSASRSHRPQKVSSKSIGLFLSWPFPESILSGSPSAFCGLALSAFALFRASYFNHELAHHAGELPGFEIVWNVSVGIPLLIPSYLYSDHLNHHSVKG